MREAFDRFWRNEGDRVKALTAGVLIIVVVSLTFLALLPAMQKLAAEHPDRPGMWSADWSSLSHLSEDATAQAQSPSEFFQKNDWRWVPGGVFILLIVVAVAISCRNDG